MECPDCQRSIPPDSRFCSYCGQKMKRCLDCELMFDDQAGFCGKCGGELTTAPVPFRPPDETDEAVRAFLYDVDDPDSYFELQRGDNTVGAGGANDVIVDHEAVSWNHAVVICRDDQVFVQDSASTNGTFVDGQPVKKPRRIHHGEVLRFGDPEFAVWLTPSMRTEA